MFSRKAQKNDLEGRKDYRVRAVLLECRHDIGEVNLLFDDFLVSEGHGERRNSRRPSVNVVLFSSAQLRRTHEFMIGGTTSHKNIETGLHLLSM